MRRTGSSEWPDACVCRWLSFVAVIVTVNVRVVMTAAVSMALSARS